MSGLGRFDYHPGVVHRCSPPSAGEATGEHLPIGTAWKCLDDDWQRGETCGKRWRVAHIDDAFGGGLGWVRRRVPWRPRIGVEHPAQPAREDANLTDPTRPHDHRSTT